MFVRWKRRKLKKRWRPGYAHYAQLVESRRIDGKPRQRVIKYLGAVRNPEQLSPGQRFGFWDTANKALSELDLDGDARQAIEAKLLAVVPRPTAEQYAEREQRRVAIRARAAEAKRFVDAGGDKRTAFWYVISGAGGVVPTVSRRRENVGTTAM